MSKDESAQPTEEQVKAANEAEEAKWQGDFKEEDLAIPYKREDKDDKTIVETDKKGDDAGTDENLPEEVETHSDPEPVITVEDPGEFKPADYSFEVTLKDGKTVKVSTPEEAEKLADDPDNFETPKQLMDFINKQNKMNRNLDKDYEKWESQKKTYDEQAKIEEERQQTVDNFTNEMLYLVDKGLIPDIDDPAAKKRWLTDGEASLDKEFVKTPGVKEQVDLLNYLVKENERRSKAGVRPLTSLIDAYNGWQLDSNRTGAEAKRKEAEESQRAAGEARKTASARVAGVSSAQQAPYVPKGIAVGNPNVFRRGAAVWDD